MVGDGREVDALGGGVFGAPRWGLASGPGGALLGLLGAGARTNYNFIIFNISPQKKLSYGGFSGLVREQI